ncbi:MAG: hypothetical protein JNM68_02030 [Dinghuibacter sp.]|nr:hypothetical protein [Dinghuibacter sp.]
MNSLYGKRIPLFYLFLLLFFSLKTVAQSGVVGAIRENNTVYLTDINGLPFPAKTAEGISGSPWLSEEWNTGSVQFAFGKRADSILLKFNLAHNKVLFRRSNDPYEFVLPVQEFRFSYSDSGTIKTAYYKSGYPDIGKNTGLSFYEMLAEGAKLHLLQYNYRKLTETYVFNGPPVFQYEPYTQLYLYDADTKTMHRIKCRKQSVTGAVPKLAEAINRLCSEKKWTLKNTEELAMLVRAL